MSKKKAFMPQFRDANLAKTIALPAAASTSVVTAGIDTGVRTVRARFLTDQDLVLTVPGLSTVILPDTKTCTLTIESDDDVAFGSPKTLGTLVLTGAGGVGIVGVSELRVSCPDDMEQYVRGKVAFGANATDGSALTAELCIVGTGSGQ